MNMKVCRHFNSKRGFSLLELMVSISILLVVMVVLLQVTGAVGEIWKTSTGKISAFQNSRSAFASITRTLAQATLNTYNDYVQESPLGSGNFVYRTSANASTFTPTKFARASELHFMSGPAATPPNGIVPNATATLNPGHAVFFQAPLGFSDDEDLSSLNRTLNSIGFYIQYAKVDNSILPPWLHTVLGKNYRFRLVQIVQPTEQFSVYTSTTPPTSPPPGVVGYDTLWTNAFAMPSGSLATGQPRPRVLAEDVCLLVIRPRLAPQDEVSAATQLGMTYNPATDPGVVGSILAPNYHYDSRSWEANYGSARVASAPNFSVRKEITRNQTPPIIDVALIGLDRRTLTRFDFTGATPPSEFNVPTGLFTDARNYEADLQTYSQQLSDARIKHRIFRTAVELQGAKWSNSN
jgi:uncharacterized protein (TIGR02599 family)